MKPTEKGVIFLKLAAASALVSYLTLTFNFFPHLGLSLSLILLIAFAYYLKKEKTKEAGYYFVISLVFSALLAIRSEGLITFLNFWTAIYFASYMLLTGKNNRDLHPLTSFFAPFMLLFGSLFTRSKYKFKLEKPLSAKQISWKNSIAAILLSILLLIITVPLLSSANPFFADLVDSVLGPFNIINPVAYLFSQAGFIHVLRLMFFTMLLFMLPKIASYSNIYKVLESKTIIKFETGWLLLPKLVLIAVLTVFFFTQLRLYFSTPEILNQMGYTLSQYTREVFAQLLVVAIIVLVLINAKVTKIKNEFLLTSILTSQGIFLNFMALKSVVDYSAAWGLTYKRLYGFAVVAWLFIIFALFVNRYRKNLSLEKFTTHLVFSFAAILITVNILNFDYLIYHYRITTLPTGTDHIYLSDISPDSLSYHMQFEQIKNIIENKDNKTATDEVSYAGVNILDKIDRLNKKYKKGDARTFSLLEYLQYTKIKDLNTDQYSKQWSLFPPPVQF